MPFGCGEIRTMITLLLLLHAVLNYLLLNDTLGPHSAHSYIQRLLTGILHCIVTLSIACDVSPVGIGAVLIQDGSEKLIANAHAS